MKRRLLILIFMICAIADSAAQTDMPRFTFGTEWSYTATFFNGHRNYFIAPEGFRVDDRQDEFKYFSNGECYLHTGYNFNEQWNLSLYIGYTSIGLYHTGLPISLRATRFFGQDHLSDRWFTYVDVGTGVSFQSTPKPFIISKMGGGYRLSLSRYSKLDFIVSFRWINTYPDVYYYGEIIDNEDIGRHTAYTAAISFGIGLTF